jgi:hypothetical protein
MLYGDSVHTHTNLGVACATGASGQNNYDCTVGGGRSNIASYPYATVSGGGNNTASGDYATVAGGYYNTASGNNATLGGGYDNTASGYDATVGGGAGNAADTTFATVGGGFQNAAAGYAATVAGGYSNICSGASATVAGGWRNYVAGDYSVILGGFADSITATADFSYLFGIGSKLTEDSTFRVDMPHVWLDDRVGIGTNSAVGKLGVSTSEDANALVLMIGSANRFSFFTHGSGTDYLGIRHVFPDPDVDIAVFTEDKRLGIATLSPTAHLDVAGSTGYSQIRMRTSYTPSSTSDTNGNAGDIAWDDNYVYIKTSAGWKRASLNTW